MAQMKLRSQLKDALKSIVRDPKEDILELFESEQVMLIVPSTSSPEEKMLKQSLEDSSINHYMFSPKTKELLEAFSPISKERLAREFQQDDEKIKLLEEEQEIKDFLYKYFENKDVGVFMEKWICANMTCPCSGKFAKYSNPNMPVVDIKCINPGHNINIHGPKYYQVKSTEIGTNMFGFEYFQLNPKQYIFVGSPAYGKYSHEIKGGDVNKRLLIGYICIKYNKVNDWTININGNESFILIPKMQVIPQLQMESYYTYIKGMFKPMITFNTNLFTIQLMKNIDIKLDGINIYTLYDEKLVIKPIPFEL